MMAGKERRGSDAAQWIRGCICAYAASGENSLGPDQQEPAWDEPLVGFSRGDDPLYGQFKEAIGSFFMTPPELFAASFPGVPAEPGELTVISWILPQTERTRLDSRREKTMPSDRWARSRKYGEDFNMKLRAHLVDALRESGHEAVSPMLSPLWKQQTSERYGLASTWSERHAAYAAGLGTFGLCDGLITPRGKAVRCGSVIARIAVPPSERPYSDHHAYCLFYAHGSCGKCVKRCPAGAVSREGGHDKLKCQAYLHGVTSKYIQARLGFETSPCGLCQTDVPCEAMIPPGR